MIPAAWRYQKGENTNAIGDVTSTDVVTLRYDIVYGYVAAVARPATPIAMPARALVLDVTVSAGQSLGVRIVDASGQILQYRPARPLGYGDRYRLGVWLDAWASKWGGANNGIVQGEIREIAVLVESWSPTRGSVVIHGVEVLPDMPTWADAAATRWSGLAPMQFGVCMHNNNAPRNFPDHLAAIGATVVRTDLMWHEIERSAGVYDFSAYDWIAHTADAYGVTTLFILCYGNSRLYDHNTPAGAEAFARFAAAASQHYAGRRVMFEVWNEPDGASFWGGTPNPEAFGRLCNAASRAIMAAGKQPVVTGGLTGFNNWPFLERQTAAGAMKQADALGVHGYFPPGEPETACESVEAVRRAQRKQGEDPPVWVTEWGWSATSRGEEAQANLAMRSYLSVLAANAPLFVWYDLVDDGADPNNGEQNFGLLRVDGKTPKAAYHAFAEHAARTRGAERAMIALDAPPGLNIVRWTFARHYVYAAWTDRPNVRYRLALDGGARTYRGNLPASEQGIDIESTLGVVYVTVRR